MILIMKEKILNEFKGFGILEIILMTIAIVLIPIISLIDGDNILGIISSVSGVLCVYLTGKGKLSSYLFGLINCVTYGYIAYTSKYYGDAMQNIFYYLPMQFVGFYLWFKNMNKVTLEVNKKHMSNKLRIISLLIIVSLTYGYGLILKNLGGNLPFIDSFTTLGSVIAMTIQSFMYAEQWWLWVAIDFFGLYMWIVDYMSGNESMATLLMWVMYLILGIVMLVRWEKEVILNERKNKNINEK